MKKICILASGGDAPGMNACIESLFIHSQRAGFALYAAVMGFDGLIHENIVPVTIEKARSISNLSGCVCKCGRSEEFTTDAGFARAVECIRKHRFECVIIIGGNGTFRGVARLKSVGVPVIAIPATVDNDLFYTKHNLGFSSAVENAVQLIDMLKATMETNDRDHVVQLMGRHNGELARMVGAASFATIVDTSRQRHTPQQVAEIFRAERERGNTSCLMVMQERKNTDNINEAIESANFLKELTAAANDKRIRMNTLGHLQRGATPSAQDRWLALNYGALAIDLIQKKQFGLAVGLLNEEFFAVDIDKANSIGV